MTAIGVPFVPGAVLLFAEAPLSTGSGREGSLGGPDRSQKIHALAAGTEGR